MALNIRKNENVFECAELFRQAKQPEQVINVRARAILSLVKNNMLISGGCLGTLADGEDVGALLLLGLLNERGAGDCAYDLIRSAYIEGVDIVNMLLVYPELLELPAGITEKELGTAVLMMVIRQFTQPEGAEQ